MRVLIQTLFFFLLVTQLSLAQWNQLRPNIPGGVVRDVIVFGDTIVVGLHNVNQIEMGVYASTDSGASWQSLGLDDIPVWSLTKCGPYLLVGTWYSGIFRSSDWGVTWERKMNDAIIFSIAVDGSNIYAVTNGPGVIISTDQGATWNISGPPNEWIGRGLAITDQFVFAYKSSIPFLIRKSKSSSGWIAISSPADTIDVIKIFALGSSVFVSTSQGLFVSRNYGSTWTKSESGLPQGSAVGYFSAVGDSIICIVSGDLYLSTDIGESWHFLASTPYSDRSTKIASNNELLVLGTQGSGVYLSIDFGETWNERGIFQGNISSLLSRGDVLLLGSGTGGVYYSSDNGENWSPSKSGMGCAWITGFSSNESTIFASSGTDYNTFGGLHLSKDEAITWTQKIIDSLHTYDVRMVQALNDLVFVNAGYGDIGGRYYSLYISTDGGDNFTMVDSLGSLSRFASNDSLLFAGSDVYPYYGMGCPPWGVYISRDQGYTWGSTTFPEQQVLSLAVKGDSIAVASKWLDTTYTSHNEFQMSTDNGNSWTTFNSGITGEGLDLIWIGNNLIASTTEGVFFLRSRSNTWSPISDGLNDSIVGNLAVHNNELFLIGASRTIWHRPISEFTLVEEEKIDEVPTEFLLSQNYPNPFNPGTKIKYSIPQTSQVQIKVFDVLGNEIETLANEEKPAGTYEITWYAEQLSSGVYFYRLKAGDFVETKKMILMK